MWAIAALEGESAYEAARAAGGWLMILLLPNWLDLAGWVGVIFAALALSGVGRLLSAGKAAPETALVAGWGAAALVLTLWGVATPSSMRLPAVAIVTLGLAGHALPHSRLTLAEWRGVARIAVLALPLLAVLASALPSEPDTFLNLLPNAAYLYDHGMFPGADRPAAHSYLPAAPYNLQLAAFIASLVGPSFPANALIAFNVVLQLGAGLLLARLLADGDDASMAPPSWSQCALGLLLATLLNPGFVPRFHLSSYSEPSVTVALAFAGWCAAKSLGRLEEGKPAALPLWLLALSLVALVNIKQDSVALVIALLMTAAALGIAGRAPRRSVAALALAALPAALLYLAWRWYVQTHLAHAGAELAPLPRSSWQVEAVPLILWHMLQTMGQKLVFYAVLAAAVAAAAWRVRRHGLDLAARAGILLGGCFVLYSAALVVAYVTLFPGTMGTDAHSYFRYSTHLSLLLMVAIALTARAHGFALARRPRFVPAALIGAMLATPLMFLQFLRFDLEPPALRVWLLARNAAPLIGARDRVALVLPGDNGSVAAMLETSLRILPPGRPDLDLKVVSEPAPDALGALAAAGYRVAILSCAPAGFPDVAPGSAALLKRDDDVWRATSVWHYPPPLRTRWSHVLADAPLCLGK